MDQYLLFSFSNTLKISNFINEYNKTANISGFIEMGGVMEDIRTKFVSFALDKGLFIPDLE